MAATPASGIKYRQMQTSRLSPKKLKSAPNWPPQKPGSEWNDDDFDLDCYLGYSRLFVP